MWQLAKAVWRWFEPQKVYTVDGRGVIVYLQAIGYKGTRP